ncbi:MAG: hypothetical protein ACLSDQ_02150 [Adlercreutzia equolifaciens]
MNIPAYFICDAACWATYSLPGHTVGAVGDGEDSYSTRPTVEKPPTRRRCRRIS